MSATGKRVLLVDDHLKLGDVIRMGLEFAGFEVTPVRSGKEGLEFVRSGRFDIILLDIRMPDMSGFEVLREIRRFSRIPVIAYSATPQYSSQALKSGADAFLAKPFGMDRLMELIAKLTHHGI